MGPALRPSQTGPQGFSGPASESINIRRLNPHEAEGVRSNDRKIPHKKALGLRVDEDLSPALVEKVAYLGARMPSFRDAHEALDVLLRTKLSQKRVERQTERIGQERVVERAAEIEEWSNLKLVQREQAPAGVKPPQVAAVLADGGRLQLCEKNPDARSGSTHWHEYKAGVLHGLSSEAHEYDPCPQIPELYLQPARIDKLAREITTVAARVEADGAPSTEVAAGEATLDENLQSETSQSETSQSEPLVPEEQIVPHGYDPPKVVDRDVIASRANSREFGRQLAARAWSLGLFGSGRKAYVGDGSSWLWTEWERHFKPFGFVPILDFIHALTHVYAAAMAGRAQAAGWEVYRRWITWIWEGNVAGVIVELAARQQELGLATDADGETSPRSLVSKTLTYLQNQQSRMNYPEYRRQGLPITSAHMESTVKLINRRVKGSEKYWSEYGAESLLQLSADHLSTSQPLTRFWHIRPRQQTGTRTYTKSTA